MGVKLRERHAYITRKQTYILHIQLLFTLTPHSYSYELERTTTDENELKETHIIYYTQNYVNVYYHTYSVYL